MACTGFVTAREPGKLGAEWFGLRRPACNNNRAGFQLTSGYELRNALGQSFVVGSVRLPFARSVRRSEGRPKLHFHRHDTPAKHPQESQNILPTRIKVFRYAGRQSRGGRQFVSPSTRLSGLRGIVIEPIASIDRQPKKRLVCVLLTIS
jgi:hypothetical protein